MRLFNPVPTSQTYWRKNGNLEAGLKIFTASFQCLSSVRAAFSKSAPHYTYDNCVFRNLHRFRERPTGTGRRTGLL